MPGEPPVLNAIVVQKIEVSPGLAIMRVVPDGWDLPGFSAGQFGVLGLPAEAERVLGSETEEEAAPRGKLIRRAYSIASSSAADEYLEFYVSLVPSGALTPRLFALAPGSRVWLGPKITGMFTLDQVPEDHHVVFLATGTGLAPYMSMLRTHLVCGGARRFAVLHGARHSWELGYRSELMTLKRMCANFTYLPIISRPRDEHAGWTGPGGYLQDLWRSQPLEAQWGFQPTPRDTHVFLCGNPSMVDSMVELLEEEEFREHSKRQAGQIHVERYW